MIKTLNIGTPLLAVMMTLALTSFTHNVAAQEPATCVTLTKGMDSLFRVYSGDTVLSEHNTQHKAASTAVNALMGGMENVYYLSASHVTASILKRCLKVSPVDPIDPVGPVDPVDPKEGSIHVEWEVPTQRQPFLAELGKYSSNIGPFEVTENYIWDQRTTPGIRYEPGQKLMFSDFEWTVIEGRKVAETLYADDIDSYIISYNCGNLSETVEGLTGTEYTITGVPVGTQCSVYMQTKDTDGLVSDKSNIVTKEPV